MCSISKVGLTRLELGSTKGNIKILVKIANALKMSLKFIGAFDLLPENTIQQQLEKAILIHGHFKSEAAASIGIDIRTYRTFMKGGSIKEKTLRKIRNYIAETEKAGE